MLIVKIGVTDLDVDVIEATGDVRNLAAEIGQLLNGLYTQLNTSDPAISAAFRYLITRLVNDADSPTWVPNGYTQGFAIITPKKEEQ